MVKTGFYLNKDLTVFVRQISCFVFVRKVEFCVVSANANPGKIYQLFFGHLVLLVEIIIPQEESQELNKNTRSRRLNQLAGGILPDWEVVFKLNVHAADNSVKGENKDEHYERNPWLPSFPY